MFYKVDIAVIFSAVCNLERQETDLLSERKHQNSSDVCFFSLSLWTTRSCLFILNYS